MPNDAVEWSHPMPRATVVRSRDDLLRRLLRGKNLLHVGCADAPLADDVERNLLHHVLMDYAASVIGLDIDVPTLSELRRRGAAGPLVGASAHELPFRPETFDCVLLGEVIEHLGSPEPTLHECKRVVRAGGSIVITTPSAFSLLHTAHALLRNVERVHPDHVAAYSPRMLASLLARAGLTPVAWWSYVAQGERERSLLAGAISVFARLRPFSAPGIVVVAEKHG